MAEDQTDLSWTLKLEGLRQLLQERAEASQRDCAKAESAAALAGRALEDTQSAKLAVEALSETLFSAGEVARAKLSATASEAGSAAQRLIEEAATVAASRIERATQDATQDATARIVERADREVTERCQDLVRRHDEMAQQVDRAISRQHRDVRVLQLVCAALTVLAVLFAFLRVFRS